MFGTAWTSALPRRRRRRLVAFVVVAAISLGRIAFFRAPPVSSAPEELFAERQRRIAGEAHAAHPNRTVQVLSFRGLEDLSQFLIQSFFGNPFCERIDALRREDPSVFLVFDFTFGCQELFQKACCGTGNFLGLLYGLRLAAEVYGDVEIHFTCPDAESTRNHLILPWFTGVVPARPGNATSAFPNLTPTDVCGGIYGQPVGHMVRVMQQDLRHMAVSLVGRSPQKASGNPSHPPPPPLGFRPQLQPVQQRRRKPFRNVAFDDAVVHFRCGDLMDSNHFSFAFMNFHGYTRHIAPDVTSIGILTQPFVKKPKHFRVQDDADVLRDRCKTVVTSLVQYIQERFSRAKVRIHTEDSIALTYVRMIFAKQTIVGISTFGVLPAVATFGTGYIRIPDTPDEVNQWLLRPPVDQLVDNVVLIQDAKAPVKYIKALWQEEGADGVLAWFWNDTWTPPPTEEVG